MKLLHVLAVLAFVSSAGCDAGPSQEEFQAVSDRLDAAEERVESLEGQLERVDAQTALLADFVNTQATGGSKPIAKSGVRPIDPEHQRRIEAVGVELLEKMAKSDAAGETIENLGALTNEYLKQAARDLEATAK